MEIGIDHILIDAEVSSYQPLKNAGPFYFTKKEFDAAHYMYDKAINMGFDMEISSYAFSVRGEYDEHHCLKLPTIYYDNIDRNIISNEIYAETFPNMSLLVDFISKKATYEVVIFGVGHYGTALLKELEKYKVEIKAVIDNNSKLWRQKEEVAVLPPEEILTKDNE